MFRKKKIYINEQENYFLPQISIDLFYFRKRKGSLMDKKIEFAQIRDEGLKTIFLRYWSWF